MSQFESQFDPDAGAERPTSKLAITALISSLIFFCPLTTLLGPVLGLIAIGTMGREKKGKGLAIAAILIGVVLTAGWVGVGVVVGGKMKEWIGVVMEGPAPALTAGFGGDTAGFKDHFYGAGATAPDAEVTAFLTALRERYGDFVSCQFDQNTSPPQSQVGDPSAVFPYQITFDQGVIDCEAEIIFADQQSGQVVMKLGYVLVPDAELGDLRYPTSSP